MSESVLEALIVAILGPGGLIVVALTLSRNRKTKDSDNVPTIEEARVAEAVREVQAAGLMEPWREYLDESDNRIKLLEKRQKDTEVRMEGQQRTMRQLVRRDLLWAAHNAMQELHIMRGMGPPPPELPAELAQPLLDLLSGVEPYQTDDE